MDIQVASNFERLYFECARRDGVETGRAFRAFAETGVIDLPPQTLATMRETFSGAAVAEDDTARTMLSTLNETGELIDPHTAVAVAAARRASLADVTTPIAVLSTAHPAKFPEAVSAATGVTPQVPAAAQGITGRPERYDHLPADADAIMAYVRAFARK
jgi:threonine synthase